MGDLYLRATVTDWSGRKMDLGVLEDAESTYSGTKSWEEGHSSEPFGPLVSKGNTKEDLVSLQ